MKWHELTRNYQWTDTKWQNFLQLNEMSPNFFNFSEITWSNLLIVKWHEINCEITKWLEITFSLAKWHKSTFLPNEMTLNYCTKKTFSSLITLLNPPAWPQVSYFSLGLSARSQAQMHVDHPNKDYRYPKLMNVLKYENYLPQELSQHFRWVI